MNTNKNIFHILNWGVTVALPIFLLMTSVRLMLSPLFLNFEYHTPNFPPDTYGFSLEDRLYWGKISVSYLNNQENIDFLGDLQFEDGSPLYNERELSHMEDVKTLVQSMTKAWLGLTIFIAFTIFLAYKSGYRKSLWHALERGSYLTIGLIFTILISIAMSFRGLFTAFHRVFFAGDTWIFLYSDTLIRLFPMRFWRDAFILVGVLTLTSAIVLILINKKKIAGS